MATFPKKRSAQKPFWKTGWDSRSELSPIPTDRSIDASAPKCGRFFTRPVGRRWGSLTSRATDPYSSEWTCGILVIQERAICSGRHWPVHTSVSVTWLGALGHGCDRPKGKIDWFGEYSSTTVRNRHERQLSN